MTQIKICGLTREADIDYVNEAMPDYAGLILLFPKSRRRHHSQHQHHCQQ